MSLVPLAVFLDSVLEKEVPFGSKFVEQPRFIDAVDVFKFLLQTFFVNFLHTGSVGLRVNAAGLAVKHLSFEAVALDEIASPIVAG